MCLKGVKLKSQNVILLSCGALELLRKSLRGAESAPGICRVKPNFSSTIGRGLGLGLDQQHVSVIGAVKSFSDNCGISVNLMQCQLEKHCHRLLYYD